jgi:hypothetical protein
MDPVKSSDHTELDIIENGLLDEAIETHGESVGSGDHLMKNLVN